MNALERIKLSKERIDLIAQLKSGAIKGLEQVKIAKRVHEIADLLGAANQPADPKTAIQNDSKITADGEFFNVHAKTVALDSGSEIQIIGSRLYKTDLQLQGQKDLMQIHEIKISYFVPFPNGAVTYSIGLKLGANSGYTFTNPENWKVGSNDQLKAELLKIVKRESKVFTLFATDMYEQFKVENNGDVTEADGDLDLDRFMTKSSAEYDAQVEYDAEDPQQAEIDDLTAEGAEAFHEGLKAKLEANEDDLNPDELSDKTTDENYRWKDTAYIPGARKFLSSAFGDAKKEGRNVNTADIDWDEVSQDMRLAQSLVTKENVFGVVDWKGLKDAGMPSDVAYLINRVYRAVAKQPVMPTNKDSLYNYVTGISTLREKLEQCRDYEQIKDALVEISKQLVKPAWLAEYYENPTLLVKQVSRLAELDTRVMTELGDSFYSWMRNTGNYALHELKTGKDPKTGDESKGKDWAWAKLEPVLKDDEGKEKKPKKASFQLEHAGDIERVGGKEVNLTSSKQLEEMFGFRGIQSGNWVLKDKSSAEFHMKATAEAMLDMADIVGIDAKHLGLNGNLALSFGARGKKGALAHYEPSTKVINITKMKGGGSLGHEYFHAIDNLIRDMVAGDVGSVDFFGTRDFNKIPDREIAEAFKQLTNALCVRQNVFEVPLAVANYSERMQDYYKAASEEYASKLNYKNLDEMLEDSWKNIAVRVKTSIGGNGTRFHSHQRSMSQFIGIRHRLKGDVPIYGENFLVPFDGLTAPSEFMHKAIALDDGKAGKYWSKEYEMAARSFSAFLQDKLAAQGRKNDYLAYSTQGGNNRVGEIAYPQGEEREAVNAAFENLFNVLRIKKVFEKAVQNKALMDALFGQVEQSHGVEPIIDLNGMFDSRLDPEGDQRVRDAFDLLIKAFYAAGWARPKTEAISFSSSEKYHFKLHHPSWDWKQGFSFNVVVCKDGEKVAEKESLGTKDFSAIYEFINSYIEDDSLKLKPEAVMLDTSYGSEDTDKAQKELIGALFAAGWDQGEEQQAANFMKYGERCAFSIESKQYSFTVVVKQKNTTAVEDKLSSNGISNLDEVYQFINRYIENEENKIQQPSAVDYAKRLEDMQQRKDPSSVDLAAQTAETSQLNTDQPPQADLENDAYRKAEIEIAGMRIAIENPVGSVRRGVDNQGNAWETVMKAHYGYFLNTLGEDGDEIDVFVVEGTEHDFNGRVFILYQIDENGAFDEHKVILGTTSKVIATKIYQEHYDENFNGIAAIKELSIEDFKEWLKNPNDGMFDGVGAQMFDNWLADGKFDLVPIKMLNIEHLELLNEPNPGAREPIVIFKKGNDLQVVQGSRRLKLAQKIGEKFVPSIILDQKEGYSIQIIKKAIKKCGSVVHAEALAAMAFQCVENEALKNL